MNRLLLLAKCGVDGIIAGHFHPGRIDEHFLRHLHDLLPALVERRGILAHDTELFGRVKIDGFRGVGVVVGHILGFDNRGRVRPHVTHFGRLDAEEIGLARGVTGPGLGAGHLGTLRPGRAQARQEQ